MLTVRRVKSRPVLHARSSEAKHGRPGTTASNKNMEAQDTEEEEEEGEGEEETEKEEEDGHKEQGNLATNYRKFSDRSIYGSAINLMAFIKSCAVHRDREHGTKIHALVIREGLLEQDTYIGSALVNMYAKCGALAKAEELFEALRAQNVVVWNALIAGYAQHGHAEKALSCSVEMEFDGVSPNGVTFICMLKACGSLGASLKGQEIHAQIERMNLGNDTVVANALIDMYAKCGLLTKAQEILDKLPAFDVISWTSLITGYAQHGQGEKAIECFEQMQAQGGGISPNIVTFLCTLKACGSIEAIDKGLDVHAEIVKKGFLARDILMSNTLVDMYAKCGMLEEAQQVFDNLPFQDSVSWNALIAGYVQHGFMEIALKCFEEMRSRGFLPDAVTFACVLKACSRVGTINKGQYVHAEISKGGLLGKDIVVGTALLDMYASCGIIEKAQAVFDEFPFQNVVLWTVLIAGYCHCGHDEDALACFERMQLGGFVADAVTFMCILQACGSTGAAQKGQEIHTQVVRDGVLDNDLVVGTALIDMYISCNMHAEAQEVFKKHTVQDVVAYNVMITRFAQRSHGEEALWYFQKMQSEGLLPNQFTLVCILKACGSLGAAYKGQEAYSSIIQLGFLEMDMVVATALMDMYVNCGMPSEAQAVFDKLLVRDLVSWTVLMAGYAQLGMDVLVFELFDRMLREGIEPSLPTFTIILNACSHTGLLDTSQIIFETMSKDFGIFPTLEHHNCIVDSLSRAGCLEKAVALTNEIPWASNVTAWHTVLGFCQIHGDRKLGKLTFEHIMQLDIKDAAAYVCMSNLCAKRVTSVCSQSLPLK